MNKSLPTLSKADREKHFPNLSRKIIIPRIEDSSGRKYAVELRKQLKETEDLVKVREGNVEKLRESIKLQHQQIVTERSALVHLEEACKAKGVPVPEEGAENIQ